MTSWTTGMIDRMDAGNAHAYAYAFLGKTCCLFDEPLFTVDNQESMKLVMGGEPMLLNPKNCTPFIHEHEGFTIMTANAVPWQRFSMEPFDNRCFQYTMNEPVYFSGRVTHDLFWSCYFSLINENV